MLILSENMAWNVSMTMNEYKCECELKRKPVENIGMKMSECKYECDYEA